MGFGWSDGRLKKFCDRGRDAGVKNEGSGGTGERRECEDEAA